MAQRPTLHFGRLEQLLGYQLRRAQVRLFQDFNRALGPYQLTPGLYGVLMIVDSNPGMNQTALSVALGVDRSTVVGVIDRLEERKWIERQSSGTDRRAHALVLTEAGQRLLRDVAGVVDAHERAVTSALSDDERAQLMRLLPKIGATTPTAKDDSK